MIYSYSFANRVRDLSDILNTVIKDEPRFISCFKPLPEVKGIKHIWNEDVNLFAGFYSPSIKDGIVAVSEDVSAKLYTGMKLTIRNSPTLYEVVEVDKSCIRIKKCSDNGGSDLIPESGQFMIICSNRELPLGKETSATQYNYLQDFHQDITVNGTELNSSLYSADNQLNRKTAFALSDLARYFNRIALFGRRYSAFDSSSLNEAGGLYYFGTGTDSLCLDAEYKPISKSLINRAADEIIMKGFTPNTILCNPINAGTLSRVYENGFQILRSDDRRGSYVAVIVNEINGRGLSIIADPDMPNNDIWVLDSAGLGIVYTGVTDTDTTNEFFDGIERKVQGAFSLEFRNAKQRCCRIKNIKLDIGTASEINK